MTQQQFVSTDSIGLLVTSSTHVIKKVTETLIGLEFSRSEEAESNGCQWQSVQFWQKNWDNFEPGAGISDWLASKLGKCNQE